VRDDDARVRRERRAVVRGEHERREVVARPDLGQRRERADAQGWGRRGRQGGQGARGRVRARVR
jgi:hypothetical protein